MKARVLKLIGVFVGVHLLLGVSLLVVEAAHGINDQDASFALALLFHYMNYPAVWLLRLAGISPTVAAVLAVGVVQWIALAAVLGGAWGAVRTGAGPAAAAER